MKKIMKWNNKYIDINFDKIKLLINLIKIFTKIKYMRVFEAISLRIPKIMKNLYMPQVQESRLKLVFLFSLCQMNNLLDFDRRKKLSFYQHYLQLLKIYMH